MGVIDKIQSMLESSNDSSVEETELLSKIRQQRTEYKSLISLCNKDSNNCLNIRWKTVAVSFLLLLSLS